MKKRIFACAVVAICISVLASTTLAYFTDIGTARNVITSGGIDIEIVEQQLVNGTLQPYPGEPIPVMPETTVSKIVSVQNLEETAWIRAAYKITVYDADRKVLAVPAEELNQVITIAPSSTNWVLKDGWWYYDTALKTNETSTPLFEEVAFSGPKMDNKYQNCTVAVDVTAEAIQQEHNGAVYTEAVWPGN